MHMRLLQSMRHAAVQSSGGRDSDVSACKERGGVQPVMRLLDRMVQAVKAILLIDTPKYNTIRLNRVKSKNGKAQYRSRSSCHRDLGFEVQYIEHQLKRPSPALEPKFIRDSVIRGFDVVIQRRS